jgi:AraC-like DNA-binding protein
MPSSAIRRFTDPHPYGEAIRAAEIELFPTTRGAFRAELTQVTLERLWVQRGRENLPRVYVGAVKPERAAIGFLTDANQPPKLHCGQEVRPGEIVFNNSKLIHRRTQAASRWGSMSLAPDDLAAVSRLICGRELTVPDASHTLRPEPALMDRLLKLHKEIGGLAKSSPDVFVNAQAARALENELVHVMVRCLDHAPSEMSASGRNHAKIVARFEEFLAENILQPIYLAEICAATGAAERTLRACCKEYLGMGPVQYLWLRRMHLARRALALGTPETATVTNTAMDHGFWELGRFSTQYRSLFGESPSETLRRPPHAAPRSS